MDIPSLQTIVANKHILSPQTATLLRQFLNGAKDTDGEDIIVFYTQAMREDEYDEANTLNIRIPLANDYLDYLLNRHVLDYGRAEHDGWSDSFYYFNNLKTVRDNFMNEVRILAEIQKQKEKFTRDVLGEYNFKLKTIPVEKHAIPYYMPDTIGSQYRTTRDEFYKKTRGRRSKSGSRSHGGRAKRATNKKKKNKLLKNSLPKKK